ncbi:MAG: hypothetical protein HY741_00375 [Chloroflexi bacterium]|nr:hypothetical protein [Chloroflexota bacterium]
MTDEIIHGKPPSSESVKWLALMESARDKSLETIDEAAKQLIGLDGLISGIYFGAVTFANLKPAVLNPLSGALLLAPIGLWFLSLIFAVLTIAPGKYPYNPHSPDDARRQYENIVERKYRRLQIALWLFVASVAALGIAMTVYLDWVSKGQITN